MTWLEPEHGFMRLRARQGLSENYADRKPATAVQFRLAADPQNNAPARAVQAVEWPDAENKNE
jgi:hypothetical protein